MERVLVTGSSGFMGSHIVDALLERGHEVVGVDLRPPVEERHRRVFRRCDLLDRDGLISIVRGTAPAVVLHLAARIDLMARGSLADYAANTRGVHHLVDALEAAPSVRRCVFTSSQLVCRVGHVPRGDRDYRPTTLYGRSKVLGERIVRHRCAGRASFCIVRPTTIWGPGMNPHYHRVFRMIARGRYFHVGRSPLFKSYGFVKNTARQYLALMDAPDGAVDGRTLYLADYAPLSLRRWTDAVAREMGAPPIPTVPLPLARAAARAGDLVNALGARSFPFNTFRLRNVLAEYRFDLRQTEAVCGPLPWDMEHGVADLVAWLCREGIVPAPRAPARAFTGAASRG